MHAYVREYSHSQMDAGLRTSISRLGLCAAILSAGVARVDGRDVTVARACLSGANRGGQ